MNIGVNEIDQFVAEHPEAPRVPEKHMDTETGLRALNICAFLQLQLPPREIVLDPIIRQRDSVMAYGWRGTGKTHFGLSLAYAIATGGSVLKWTAPQPRRVLYIDGEMPAVVMQERLSHLVAACDKEPPEHDFLRIINPDIHKQTLEPRIDAK